MANNYLQFSEVVAHLTADEETWLREQLTQVYVFGDKEYDDEHLPRDKSECDADWTGCRAFRDLPGYDPDCDSGAGFCWDFQTDPDDGGGGGRHLWLYSEESAYLGRVVHLVQKFLKRFRPDQCWSLTYSTICSKPRVGEFSGGAAFVTADGTAWQHAHDFVEQHQAAFLLKQQEKVAERLALVAEDRGIAPEQLDDAVHDAADAVASAVNNDGLRSQVGYLIEHLGIDEATGLVASLSPQPYDEEETP